MWSCGSIKVLEHGETDWLLIKVKLRGPGEPMLVTMEAAPPDEPYDRV